MSTATALPNKSPALKPVSDVEGQPHRPGGSVDPHSDTEFPVEWVSWIDVRYVNFLALFSRTFTQTSNPSTEQSK